MKYKITKGSNLYDNMMDLVEKIKEVNNEAAEIVKSLGAEEYSRARGVAWGGITAIKFDNPPDGWVLLNKKYRNAYRPSAKNKVWVEKLSRLKTISYKEINDMIGFVGNQIVDLRWIYCPAITFLKNVVLIEIPDGAKYSPVEGVIEILNSEYEKIKEKGGEQ